MPQSNPDWKPSSVGIALAAYQPYPIWFAEQLDSLVAQTYSNWHCVITMDSPLRDIQGAAQLLPYLGDPRFTWVENTERLGVRKNFEKAIRLAAQRDVDLIAFADQDDIWVPEKLAESVDAIKHSGPMSLVTTDAYLFSEELILSETIASLHRITRTNLTIEEIIIYPSVTGLTVLVDADLVRLHPQIPAPMRYHDHWYSVVATAYGGVYRVFNPLAFYRQHEGNSIGISGIRDELGLNAVGRPVQASNRMQIVAQQHLGSALAAAGELPRNHVRRALFKWRIGWIALMLKIICSRAFTERLLVIQAYRAMVAQFMVFQSQSLRLKEIRARVPIRGRLRIWKMALVSGVVITVTALNPTEVFDQVLSARPLFWISVSAAALALPFLKIICHVYPSASLLLIGVSALAAAVARIISGSALVSVVVFALPLAWHLAYRLRWRGDTGY